MADAAGNTLSVVSDIDTKKYKLVMKGDMRNITIGKIKKHLAGHCHIPIEEQILTFGGTALDDSTTGQVVGLYPGAQLRLSRRAAPPHLQQQFAQQHMQPQPQHLQPQHLQPQPQHLPQHLQPAQHLAAPQQLPQPVSPQHLAPPTQVSPVPQHMQPHLQQPHLQPHLQPQHLQQPQHAALPQHLQRSTLPQAPAEHWEAAQPAHAQHAPPLSDQRYRDGPPLDRHVSPHRQAAASAPAPGPSLYQELGSDRWEHGERAERLDRMIGGSRRERELEERCARLDDECARLQSELAATQSDGRQRGRELEHALREVDRLQHDRRELEMRQRSPPRAAGVQLARQNLAEFGQELGVQHQLDFDENMTCVVGVEQKYTILLTYDQSTERLYVYSTLLTYLPKDEQLRLRLFETLLEGALLGRDMSGGGVGVSVKNELILMATSIDLRHSDSSALREVAPQFVECLIKWRAAVRDVLEQHARAAGVLPEPQPERRDWPAAAPSHAGSYSSSARPPPPVSPASYARAHTGAAPAQPAWQNSAAAALQQLDSQERDIVRQQQLIQQQRHQLEQSALKPPY
eukprot:TRINITY_DN2803_c0_g1_i1.p1 TRINITY_DN2803_c0_g1~~TRINITY_DN2803_c0_g1_i1.p1  ORF type:complete len:592 (+),score=273.77 TRINITY_DN2803_c0_g1_i1:58-1776(+)